MSHEYIHIYASRKTPRRQPVTQKSRKPSPDRDAIIEIVQSDVPSKKSSTPKAKKIKSRKPDTGRENHKVSALDRFLGQEWIEGNNQQTGVTPDRRGQPIDYGDTLFSCSTVEEVRDWFIGQQADFNEKVDRGFARRRLSDETRTKADKILNQPGATPIFMIGNDRLALEAFEKLRDHLTAYVSTNPENEVALITFIDGRGGTSLDRPVIEVRNSRKLVDDIMRKLVPHWLGVMELAFFTTIQHPDGGLHLQRHEHAAAWGPNFIADARRLAVAHVEKLTPNVTNADRIDITPWQGKSEVDLARLAAYLLKAPARAKNWCPPLNGKKHIMNHTEAKDRYIQFLRHGQLRSVLSIEDIIFGGNDGSDIKSAMIRDMRKLAESDARGRDAIHPGLIPTFWEDFNGELGQTQWALPAILRR